MGIIVEGQLFALILLAAFIVFEIYFRGRKKANHLKRIEGVEKIDEAIGRASEMGRPVLSSTGIDSLSSMDAPAIIANLDVIGYIAKETAKLGTKLILAIGPADVLPVATQLYREACVVAGSPESFREDNVRFLTAEQWPYTAGVVGIMERERPGATILVGRYHAEALHFGIVGKRIGAMTIAGNTELGMTSFFVVTCDYTLLGEEVYATGAYLSKDTARINAISSQDTIKWIILALFVIGTIAATVGSGIITTLLKL